MLSAIKMRNLVIKYAQLGQKNPDYYFIQGYLLGLTLNPKTVVFSTWLSDLFGDMGAQDKLHLEYIRAIHQLYNVQMDKVMSDDLALPSKCVLSTNNFKQSLQPEQPLPQWCGGMLTAIELINSQNLTVDQSIELDNLTFLLTGFSSDDAAKSAFLMSGQDYQKQALHYKRSLTMHLSNTLFVMRFKDAQSLDDDMFFEEELMAQDQLEQVMSVVLNNDSPAVMEMLEGVIAHLDQRMGQQFITDNTGMFWMLSETKPYMTLRARHAQLLFNNGQLQAAIDELQQLIKLNPSDNQANRYPLINYLLLAKQWTQVEQLIETFNENSLFMLAAKTLRMFVSHGDCDEANHFKKSLRRSSKYFERYITGQLKAPKDIDNCYLPGDKNEVFYYLSESGKEVWRSVDGALFWLRRL